VEEATTLLKTELGGDFLSCGGSVAHINNPAALSLWFYTPLDRALSHLCSIGIPNSLRMKPVRQGVSLTILAFNIAKISRRNLSTVQEVPDSKVGGIRPS